MWWQNVRSRCGSAGVIIGESDQAAGQKPGAERVYVVPESLVGFVSTPAFRLQTIDISIMGGKTLPAVVKQGA